MPESIGYLALVIGAFCAFAITLIYARIVAGNR